MSDWTDEALAIEGQRRAEVEANGLCPDSGYTIARCWATDLCDCAYAPPVRCPTCEVAVWSQADHDRRKHPALPR